MIIDCHTHLNNYHDETQHSLTEDLARLQLMMRRHRIDAALVLTSYKIVPAPVGACRRRSHQSPAKYQRRRRYFGATFDAEQVSELRSLLEARAIKGLKLYPGYEPFYPGDRS